MARDPRKGDLVRSLPRDVPIKQVQKRVKEAGLGTISKSYLQRIRAEMPKRAPRAVAEPPAENTNGHALPSKEDRGLTDGEKHLYQAMMLLGVERSRKLLEGWVGEFTRHLEQGWPR